MKINLLLLLCWALRVRADILHEGIAISGCSETDGEEMYGLDDEEGYYADFIKGEGVSSLPEFAAPIDPPEFYALAVVYQHLCRQNLEIDRQALKNQKLELDRPSIHIIYSRDHVELGRKNKLICQVSGFYPAPVKIYWTKNTENVTEGIRSNVPYPNKDGTYHQFSSLIFDPQLGDVYSCSVEHPALQGLQTRMWEVEKTQPGLGPSIFCGVGLTVGLLGVATGTFFLIKGNECS